MSNAAAVKLYVVGMLGLISLSAMLWGCGGKNAHRPSLVGNELGKPVIEDDADLHRSALPPELRAAGEQGFALPPLPQHGAELSDARLTSASSYTVLGKDRVPISDRQGLNQYNRFNGNSFVIVPGGDDPLAYAMYVLGGGTMDNDRPVKATVTVQAASQFGSGDQMLPLHYWIAVSNYSANAWKWDGPFTEAQEVDLNSEDVRERLVSRVDTQSDPPRNGLFAFCIVAVNSPQLGLTAVQVDSTLLNVKSTSTVGAPTVTPGQSQSISPLPASQRAVAVQTNAARRWMLHKRSASCGSTFGTAAICRLKHRVW